MAHETDLRLLTLAGIAHRCAQETEHFFQRRSHDPRYCFELFRRAVVERDGQAWGQLYTRYRPLVAGWVERHSAFAASGEEVQFFVNRAFEKMWSALSPDSFDSFPNLKSLLRYLQVCVHSAILDQTRKAELFTASLDDEDMVAKRGQAETEDDNHVLDRMQRQEFWNALDARLHDERERRVVYESFVLGLKPREIQARYQETFDDVKQVYRVKENVLARLRRDAELVKFLSGDA
jgi:RNA polymerase sigma factor (sigma-70 family)